MNGNYEEISRQHSVFATLYTEVDISVLSMIMISVFHSMFHSNSVDVVAAVRRNHER